MIITEEPETKPAESGLASKWRRKIGDALQHWKPDFRRMEKMRKRADGTPSEDSEGKTIPGKRVSWAYASVEGLMPAIYARMPEVQVQAKESTNPQEYPWLNGFARTLEILVNAQMEEAGFKSTAKAALRMSMVDGVAWAKVGYQRTLGEDPVILQRIADSQDNMQALEAVMRDAFYEFGVADLQARHEEIQAMIAGLESRREIVTASGLVVDLVHGDDVLIDPTMRHWHEWEKARWIAHRIIMPLEQAKAQFPGAEFRQAAGGSGTYPQPITSTRHETGQTWAGEEMVTIWEVWHKESQSVYTLEEDGGAFVREPYQPENVAQCWYPFQPLALHLSAGRFYPVGLVERVLPLDDEYNEARDKYHEHRKKAVPAMLFRRDSLTAEDAKKLVSAEMMEFIPLDGAPGSGNVESEVGLLRYPPVDQALYDTSTIRFDIEVMSGLQDAQRGAIAKAKTAAEAEIMSSATSNRISAMQDTLEDWIQRIAEMGAEMMLLTMGRDEVEKYCGAGAVFPELDRESAYRLVRLKIRAGTMGKPDRISEQRNWAQVTPVVMQMMQAVTQSEMQGMPQIAEAYRELLSETLRRLDERFEVDRLLPRAQPPQPAPMPQQMQPQDGMPPTPMPMQGQNPNELPPAPMPQQEFMQ